MENIWNFIVDIFSSSITLYIINALLIITVIFNERKSPSAILAWIMILTFVPVVGFIFYLVFNQNLSRSKINKMSEREEQAMSNALKKQMESMDRNTYEFKCESTEKWKHLLKLNQVYGKAYYTQDNEIELFTDGSKMTQAGFNFNGDAYSAIYQGLNYQKGELLFSEDGKKANYNNDVTKENMQFLKDLYDKYKVGSVDFGNDYTQSFGNGQSAMIYAWGHMEGTLKEKYPDIDYGVFATPTFSEDTPFAYDRYNGESTPGVNKNQSKEQQAVAQDFIKYLLANDDYIREAVSELNSFPAKTSLQNDKDILSKPVMAAIQPRVDRLIWPGPAPSTVESSGTTAFQNVFQNGMSIDKALKEAQNQMDTDMKSSDFTSMESKYAYFDEHK